MGKMSNELLHALQARAARSALAPSSMRGAGSGGVVAAGRRFLAELPLTRFGTPRRSRFLRALDTTTEDFRLSLPRGARHWGLARKGLNIFLRECLYTVYLRRAHSLHLSERFYEIPLDSITGIELYHAAVGTLPPWRTVRGLTPAVSQAYQEVAAKVARERHMVRVHLDAVWWGLREQE